MRTAEVLYQNKCSNQGFGEYILQNIKSAVVNKFVKHFWHYLIYIQTFLIENEYAGQERRNVIIIISKIKEKSLNKK